MLLRALTPLLKIAHAVYPNCTKKQVSRIKAIYRELQHIWALSLQKALYTICDALCGEFWGFC